MNAFSQPHERLLHKQVSTALPTVDSMLPTALAPMQDVTDLPFMRLLGSYGPPDFFFTEYFRVHANSVPEKHIVDSIRFHNTGKPVFAQLIGEDLQHLARTAVQLQQLPVAGIDLNMGCPAPKVYRKNVGGGLLRDTSTIESIFATLRQACSIPFTVKMRIGFADSKFFTEILDLVNRYRVDLLSVHGRTVRQMYRGAVDYSAIRTAVQSVKCPVLVNGNVTSVAKAHEVHQFTGAFGVMIGRSAIRNPWIFRQIRQSQAGLPVFQPRLLDVRGYIDDLWSLIRPACSEDRFALNRLKKFVNFIGQSVDPDGRFLHRMRRATDPDAFFAICDDWLSSASLRDCPFPAEPYPGVIARPNSESDSTNTDSADALHDAGSP